LEEDSLTPVYAKRAKNSDSQSSQTLSIKSRVSKLLDENPLYTPKRLCELARLPYKRYQDYVTHLRSTWKHDTKIGLRSRCPKQHNVRAFCYVPKGCNRVAALDVGWELSRNRNKTVVWNRDKIQLGRVEWFTSGKVIAYVRKPQTMARAKQILANAFCWTGLISDSKLIVAFLDSVKWRGSHDVHETAERLPYKVIDNYVESHGVRIVLGDRTHPNAVEVQWVYPDWLERLELLQSQNIKTIEMNSQQIEEFSKFLKDLSVPKQPSQSAKNMVV
jgi:hypothetical protein